ncbi:MAG: trypsin-like peptidase domain-containing protein [Clostridiales bacterium]|nr:trypsin-like peptidase domain-containing protein [Clostridiales bacterium]
MKLSFGKFLVILLIFSFVAGTSVGGSYWLLDNRFGKSDVELVQRIGNDELMSDNGVYSVEEIVEKIAPSVIAITSRITQTNIFNMTYDAEASGSGIIFDINNDGIFIVTNNHVIDGASEITVDLGDNIIVSAELTGRDSDTDLAVIFIKKENVNKEILDRIKPVVFGDSSALKVGEIAIAIGNPLGYNHTVTVGVISALNRDLMLSQNDINLIQTDAAINPGNSGGALVNGRGEVVGINAIKIADTNVEGIGFAIPINEAIPIISALIKDGFIARPYLGISARTITEDSAEVYNLPIGVIIADIDTEGPAYRAGMRIGDVIIEFEGKVIVNTEQLVEEKNKYDVGEVVSITAIDANGDKKVFNVKLDKY